MMIIRHLYYHLSGIFLVLVSCLLILHLQVLPVEYGGTGGSLAEITEFWVTEAVKQKDWFARFVPRCSCLIHNAVINIQS